MVARLVLGGRSEVVAQVLDQILHEVADAFLGLSGAGEHALDVHLGAEAHHVIRPCLRVRIERVQRLLPGRQRHPRVRVDVRPVVPLGVVRLVVDRHVRRGPPHAHVCGRRQFLDHRPRQGAPDGEVRVRGTPLLRFDDREVLHLVAGDPAQVLRPAVEQLAEVQGVPSRAHVVVGRRVHRGVIVPADLAVAVQRGRDEQRGPEGRASLVVGVDAAEGGLDRWSVWQVGRVLPAPR
jgi:hypothetical protein